jgi:hypothetical protein
MKESTNRSHAGGIQRQPAGSTVRGIVAPAGHYVVINGAVGGENGDVYMRQRNATPDGTAQKAYT